MSKMDFKKDLKYLYKPSSVDVSFVEVPQMNFLMIDGRGDPNTSPEYAKAVEALFALAYGLKFKVKRSDSGLDYGVMPLEGLWWMKGMSQFSVENKEAWEWTMMIAQPEYVTPELFAETSAEVEKKKGMPVLSSVRFEPYYEGHAAQIMYIGPYSEEGQTIARIHASINQKEYRLRGKHHEIYLNDPRKTASEKLQTIIRQPFEKVEG